MPICTVLDPNNFFASKTQTASWPKRFGAKNEVLSEIIRKSQNGPKMVPNDEKHVIFIIWFGDFWSEKKPFEPPRT